MVNSDDGYLTLSKRVNANMIYITVAPGYGLIWTDAWVARGFLLLDSLFVG